MATSPVVLLAGHNPGIERLLTRTLEDEGFRILIPDSATDPVVPAQDADIAVFDMTSRDSAGLEMMQRVRRVLDLPVIMLTADSSRDRITALELGADDVVTSPFIPEELTAHIRAVLRRATRAGAIAIQGIVHAANGTEIDLAGRAARVRGELVPFTKTEWALMYYLASNPGRVLTNEELLTKVWGEDHGDFQYLRIWISRVRRKIERDPEHPEIIKTVQGVGYVFEPLAPTSLDVPPPETGGLPEDNGAALGI